MDIVASVDSGDTWQSRALRRVKESRERERARESTRGVDKAKLAKAGGGARKEKGKGNVSSSTTSVS